MKQLKSIADILNNQSDTEEVYASDQKRRNWRKKKGYFTRDDNAFSFIHLIKAWEEIVGKMLADNSIPLRIKSNTLFVSTKHQIFAQEMSFLDQTILGKIYSRFPELKNKIIKIKYINNEFTLQHFNQPISEEKEKKQKAKLHPYSPEYKRRLFNATELFKDIEDEDVRDALMSYYLS